MDLFSTLLAILAGIFTTIETTINAELGKHITPSVATLHSLIVGVLFMLVFSIFGGNITNYSKITNVNPVLLLGGLFGALIIYFSSKAIPEIGISNTMILILSGQLVSGLVVDVYKMDMVVSNRKALGLILFLIGTIMYLKE